MKSKVGERVSLQKLSEERLKRWLHRDRNDVRKEILRGVLELREFSVDDLHDYLLGRGVRIKIKSLRSILGYLNTSVGIIKRKRTPVGLKYELRSDLAPIVRRIIL